MNKSAHFDDTQCKQKGVISPPVIIGGIIALVVIFLVATGNFKFSASINKNPNQAASSDSQENKQLEPTPESKPKTYQNAANSFSLEYPADWSLRENPTAGYIAGFFSPKESSSDNYMESLGIKAIDASSQPNVTLQELADAWENQTKKAESTFVVVERKSSTIAGEDAKDIIYTFKDKADNGKGMTRVTLKNKKAYVFQYNALENTYDKYLADIETILSSVKF